MRLVAATALVQLYAVDDHVPLLHKFTVRFASRYAEIIYDLSEAVSVKGVRARQPRLHMQSCMDAEFPIQMFFCSWVVQDCNVKSGSHMLAR